MLGRGTEREMKGLPKKGHSCNQEVGRKAQHLAVGMAGVFEDLRGARYAGHTE